MNMTSTTVAVILVVITSTSIWIASAKPFLPLLSEKAKDITFSSQDKKNVFAKFVNVLANLEDHDHDPVASHDQLEVDEEKINEKAGISKNPHMYGDLLLTPKQEKLLDIDGGAVIQGFKDGISFWPNRIVPYQLDSRLNLRARHQINNAIQDFTTRGCIAFVQRTQQNWWQYPNYVYFTPGSSNSGCFSYLGMIGGKQTVNIGRGCEHKGIVQHEILHALGRVHEQSRPDRDGYVIINARNIRRDMRHNFRLQRADTSLPYDYGSIMHYGRYDFSANGRATITPRRAATIGQRDRLSRIDWRHLQRSYCQKDKA